ncbi:transposase, partial [Colletotrichum incanum]
MAASEGQQPLLTYRGSLYNIDETGILEGKGSNGLVLGRAKTKSTTNKTAVTWLKRVFLSQTAPSQSSQARLLIPDGHGSHTTTEFMWQCYINDVYLLFLPPHTSHVLQPLDQLVFSLVKSAYRKKLRYLSQWNDSTIVGKRNFISCYQKARLARLMAQNIKTKPLMSSLLLPASNSLSTPLNKTSKGIQGIQDAQGIDGWASASSAVLWSTPRKARELD